MQKRSALKHNHTGKPAGDCGNVEKCVISSPKHFRNYRGKKTLRNNLPCGKLQVETNPACGNNTGGKLPWGKIESTVGKQFEFFYREPACRPIHFVSLHTPKCFSRKPRMAPQRPERADAGFLTIRNFVSTASIVSQVANIHVSPPSYWGRRCVERRRA